MVKTLVEYLKECSDAYYNTDKTLVDNDTYDAMVRTLRKIAPDHPYLSEVGSPVTGSSKVGRLQPMGTLSKYHTEEEVKEWWDSENTEVFMSPKYDGFGVELLYEDGYLVMASTRGDGHVGEDITSAMMRVKSVPIRLPEEYRNLTCVRGEAIVPRKNHEALKSLGYAAMRNAVPGIVKSNRADALIYVDFVAYEFFDGEKDRVYQRKRYKSIFIIEALSAHCSPTEFDRIKALRNSFGAIREDYEYEADGVVLKTRYIKEDNLLCPNHQIAWKYKSNRETTVLRGIEFQVGATGAISVVGIFDEVEFQGARLKRASIGSLQRYESMKPCIGDLVEVSRRGDIIPYIEEVVLHNGGDYKDCSSCPCCGTLLKEYKCTNDHCHERIKLKLYQYIKGVGVKGIGYSLVVSLVDNDMISDIPDIYYLDCVDILKLPRQGQSSVDKWLSLQNKELSTFEFLCCYPFENSGKSTWKALLEKYTLEEILSLDVETLESARIKGLGSGKIESLVSQIQESKEEIKEMIKILNLR